MRRAVKRVTERPRGPGRPRSKAAKDAILKAAVALLEGGGPGAVTMEAIAAKAGVGKPTVYRWWPDRHAVLMAALMEREAEPQVQRVRQRVRRSAVSALRQQLHVIARRFATTTGRHVTSMIAASDPTSELSKAFRNHFVLARRVEGKGLLEQAIENGEIRRDLDVDVALDLLYGALFFRLLMGHARLDEKFMDNVLDDALRGWRR